MISNVLEGDFHTSKPRCEKVVVCHTKSARDNILTTWIFAIFV